MNDAAVVGRLCDWSEYSLQSVTTVKTNGECEAGAKQEGWIRTKETTATRGTPKRPGGFSRFWPGYFSAL